MHYVPFNINQDVAIMSVLDLQNVAHERVGSERPTEVFLRLFEPARLLIFTELLMKVINQLGLLRLCGQFALQRIDRKSILHHFNQAAPLPSCKDFIRFQPEVQLFQFEYLIHLCDQLHRELLLTHVIIALDYNLEEAPSLELSERGALAHSLILLSRHFCENGGCVCGCLLVEHLPLAATRG